MFFLLYFASEEQMLHIWVEPLRKASENLVYSLLKDRLETYLRDKYIYSTDHERFSCLIQVCI